MSIIKASDITPAIAIRLARPRMPNLKPAEAVAKSLRRRQGGRDAQRLGANFQTVVVASAAAHPKLIELAELPQCGGRYVGKGRLVQQEIPCDFMGAVIGTGRAIFFDAKRCGEDTGGLQLNNPKVVKPHQIDFLVKQRRAGAIAGFLVECCRHGKYLWLDAMYAEVRLPIAWPPCPDPLKFGDQWIVLGDTTSLIRFGDLLAAYPTTSSNESGIKS